jgi:hypothetical protein
MAAARGRRTGHSDIAGDLSGRVASLLVDQRVDVEVVSLLRHSSSGERETP